VEEKQVEVSMQLRLLRLLHEFRQILSMGMSWLRLGLSGATMNKRSSVIQ